MGSAWAVGDYDGDGRPDLFVTRFGSYVLLHNQGDGTFADATAKAGLGGDRDWPTSAAFADLDGDGDLDLYVCHYLAWDFVHPTLCHDTPARRRVVSCLPLGFPARPDHLYRNDGGHFVDVTESAGIIDRDGRGLGVVAADFDDDGRIDLFVANDMTANYLFQATSGTCDSKRSDTWPASPATPRGDTRRAWALPSATSTTMAGRTWPSRTSSANRQRSSATWRAGLFSDATAAVGLKAPSRFLLGFGITFLDVDNDGCLDLATANGHVSRPPPEHSLRHAGPALDGRFPGAA